MKKLKLILWNIGLMKESVCPVDGSQLTTHGFVDNDYGQSYTCSNEECEFNE